MSASGEVVYLVDDDPGVREALGPFFQSLDIQCVGFRSADEYLAYPRTDEAACLILDLQLPGIGGLELQERLMRTSSPPIVFITGYGDVSSTVRAMKCGAVEFLTKPVDTSALVSAVTASFAQDRALREQRADLSSLRRHFALLSPREREVLPLVISGLLNKQSAALLGITEVTLQVHRSQIMRKMAAGSFADLVRMASKLGVPMARTEPVFSSGSQSPKG
ncbi:MAG: response regulator [Gammaproteobacteria bacterium]